MNALYSDKWTCSTKTEKKQKEALIKPNCLWDKKNGKQGTIHKITFKKKKKGIGIKENMFVAQKTTLYVHCKF